MITLSNAASETKTVLKWGGIIVVGLIFIWILFIFAGFIKALFFPEPPPPPTVGFGKIYQISFPKQTEVKDLTFTVDTDTGAIPVFPDREKVFTIKSPDVNLLSLENVTKKLKAAGFESTPLLLEENIYRWSDSSNLKRLISFDIFSSNFNLSSSYLANSNISSGKNFPDKEMGIETATEFLEDVGSYPDDLDDTKTKVNLFAISNSNIVPATSLSNAQLMQIFFFQKDVDKKAIYYPKPDQSTMYTVVTGGDFRPEVVQANFFHQKISDKSETYPIKTGEEAFAELKKGNAYIASYQGTKKEILIKKVCLGYYMQDTEQQYLIPIFVFKGDDNFTAYITAVKDEWINK